MTDPLLTATTFVSYHSDMNGTADATAAEDYEDDFM